MKFADLTEQDQAELLRDATAHLGEGQSARIDITSLKENQNYTPPRLELVCDVLTADTSFSRFTIYADVDEDYQFQALAAIPVSTEHELFDDIFRELEPRDDWGQVDVLSMRDLPGRRLELTYAVFAKSKDDPKQNGERDLDDRYLGDYRTVVQLRKDRTFQKVVDFEDLGNDPALALQGE